jgi:hypothetical protein
MESRRSQRKLKPTTIWEQKGAPSAAKGLKITKKNCSNGEENGPETYYNWTASRSCKS